MKRLGIALIGATLLVSSWGGASWAKSSHSLSTAYSGKSLGKCNAKGNVSFMFWGDKGEKIEQTALVKEAEKACPGLHVNAFWDQGNYDDDLATKVGSGNAPDVFELDGSKHLPEFVTEGAARDLTPFVKRDKLKLKKIYWASCLPETKYKGHVYGLLRDCGNQSMLIYNKDMFKARGVKFPTNKWTYKDLLKAAVKLSGNYAVPTDNTSRLRFGIAINTDDYRTQQYMWNWGGDWLSKNLHTCTMTSKASRAGLQWWHDLAYVHHGAPTPSQQQAVAPDVIGGFHDQRYAMAFVGPWVLNYVVKPSKYLGNSPVPFKWGIALNPGGPKNKASFVAATDMIMYKHTKNPNGAWWLMKFLTMGKSASLLAKYGIGMGGAKSIVKSKNFLNEYQPYSKAWIQGLHFKQGRTPRLVPQYTKFVDTVGKDMDPFWKGTQTVQQATSTVCKDVAPLLP